MIVLIWNSQFKKKLQKYVKKPDHIETIEEKLKLFVENPYNPLLKNHKLTGNLKGLRAIVIEYDCRLIFDPLNTNEVLLVDIGGHDDVY